MSNMKRHLEAVEGTRATDRLEKLIAQHKQELELTEDIAVTYICLGLLKAMEILKNSETL